MGETEYVISTGFLCMKRVSDRYKNWLFKLTIGVSFDLFAVTRVYADELQVTSLETKFETIFNSQTRLEKWTQIVIHKFLH